MSGRTISMKLAEMTEGEVECISIVTAGASGQPIKRLKSDTEGGAGMLEFKLRDVLKKDTGPDGPELLAVVVSEEGNLDAAKTICKAAGLTEFAEERAVDGGVLLLPRKDTSINTNDETQVVEKLTDDMAVVCKVSKQFAPFNGSKSFNEAHKGQGFFPQLRGALETFGEVTFNVVNDAKTPADAAAGVKKAAKEFTALVTSMTEALPKSVFKMEDVIQKTQSWTKEEVEKIEAIMVTVNAVESPPSGDAAIEPDPAQAEMASEDGVDSGAAMSVNKDDGEGDEAEGSEAGDGTSAEGGDAEGEVQKADSDDAADDEGAEDEGAEDEGDEGKVAVQKENPELKQILDAVQGLSTGLQTLSQRMDGVEALATKSEKAANAAQRAIKGTVVSDPSTDRDKSEGKPKSGRSIPLLDTGHAPVKY